MTSDELARKMNTIPHGTPMYLYCNGKFLSIDCVRYDKDDEECIIIPIEDPSPSPKK